MSFHRHLEIYHPMSICWLRKDLSVEGATVESRSLAHRLDESPVGYSWRDALQQSPLPLHQPRLIVRERSAEGNNCFRPGAGVS